MATGAAERWRQGWSRAAAARLAAFAVAGVAGCCSVVARPAAAAAPETLRAGDEVAVAGSRLTCVVSSGPGAATLVCGVGADGLPDPSTFAFAIADSAAVLLGASASGQPRLVGRRLQTVTVPGVFPTPRRKPGLVRVRSGDLFLVGGTDVLCVVARASGHVVVTCGLAARGGSFLVGSVAALVSERVAVLSYVLPHDRIRRITARSQPGGPLSA